VTRFIAAGSPTPAPLTVAECARIAAVCPRTVRRWIDDERFKSWRPVASGSGRRLVDRESFFAFLGIGAEATAGVSS